MKGWYVGYKLQLTAEFGSVTEIVSFQRFSPLPGYCGLINPDTQKGIRNETLH
jgi:hypothetical protein